MGAVGADRRRSAALATHTFLFTDVEASTSRWLADPERMGKLLAQHDETLREVVQQAGGRLFKHTGDGICAAFSSVRGAALAAAQAQRQLELPSRMAIHTGEASERDGDFFGLALSRCARLMDVAHAGQVLLSQSSASVGERLAGDIELRDLGMHRLRDLGEAEHVFQLAAPGLQEEFPALRSLDAVRHNLPVLRSSFVGREDDLSSVCELLERAPLVTLTGVGGCGKTRLALEVAARSTEQFPRGVFFVDLSILSDAELVSQAVAQALGLQLADPGADELARQLADRRLLLVLDNCEHLLDSCAELAELLLARCPEPRLLATSREPLGVGGEEVFRVPSLKHETDAARLFVDRARAAGAPLLPSRDDAAVTEICRRLDGIPLAIELAAARMTHLSAEQILERLSDRFRLLTGGRRRVQRQQTLAAAIDWSHDLLSTEEQTLFRRLAVFRGSFSLEAAERICDADAVDLLGSLVEKSLVIVEQKNGAAHYRLLETVRAYAEERLVASGEATEVRSSHRDHYLQWLETIPIGSLVTPESSEELLLDADNLNAALEWSLAEGRIDLVAAIASRMLAHWWSFWRTGELTMWWETLSAQLGDLPESLHAAALLVGAQQAMLTGDFPAMEQRSAAAIRVADASSWEAAYAWMLQAMYWPYVDVERARHCIAEGTRAAEAAGVLELRWMTRMWSFNLLTGDPERDAAAGAEKLIAEATEAMPELWGWPVHFTLAIVAALGDAASASRLAELAPDRSTERNIYGQRLVASLLSICEGKEALAVTDLIAMAATVREHAIPLGEPSCLTCIAALAAQMGEPERASRLLACVRGAGPFPFRTPADVLVYRRTARRVRAELDEASVVRCRSEGAALPVGRALDEELERLQSIRPAAALR